MKTPKVIFALVPVLVAFGIASVVPIPAPGMKVPRASKVSPTIVYFRAEPSRIMRGQSSMLKWKVTGATAVTLYSEPNTSLCEIRLGRVDPEGSIGVCPSETTTYVLTAEGPDGEAMQSLTVRVSNPSLPTTNTGSIR
jgi:hypothetical protein